MKKNIKNDIEEVQEKIEEKVNEKVDIINKTPENIKIAFLLNLVFSIIEAL